MQKLTVENFDKFDEWQLQAICQCFSLLIFSFECSPMKPTINLSKFRACPIRQKFFPVKHLLYGSAIFTRTLFLQVWNNGNLVSENHNMTCVELPQLPRIDY